MRYFLILLLTLTYFNISAQYTNRYKKQFEEAKSHVTNKNYYSALEIFKNLHEKAPNNYNIQYFIGLCYFKTLPKSEIALKFLERAKENISLNHQDTYNETNAPLKTYFVIGKIHHYNANFDSALNNYNLYLSQLLPNQNAEIKEVKRYIIQVENAIFHYNNPAPVFLENLGEVINSEFQDFTPVVSHDYSSIIYTSRRPSRRTARRVDHTGQYFEDVYIADHNIKTRKFSNRRKIEGRVNTTRHEAAVSLSWDGNTLFLYKDEFGEGNVYMSIFEEGRWSRLVQLAYPINTIYNEKHAFLSSDGSWLYFVSDRPGGVGGLDIYKSKRLGFNSWDIPQNLGNVINTEFDEEGPVMIFDDKTLYFSSQGHSSMGGYDIFVSLFIDNEWTTPKNIGYPINTTADDVFFLPTISGEEAFISTDRLGGFGLLDIYRLKLQIPIELRTIISGFVVDVTNNQPVFAEVNLKNTKTGEIEQVVKTNPETGTYSFNVLTNRQYEIIIKGENYISSHTLDLNKDRRNVYVANVLNYWFVPFHTFDPDTIKANFLLEHGDAHFAQQFALRNVFFDFDKFNLRKSSIEELDRIIEFMELNPELHIEVNGHTDIIGTKNYNKILSTNRAKTVKEYLLENGISPNRIHSNALWFSTPSVSTHSSVGRQVNRRVEFRVIAEKEFSNFSFAITTDKSNIKEYKVSDKLRSNISESLISNFHIIAGSFSSNDNAKIALNNYRQKGFKDAIILHNIQNNTFRVSIKNYNTKEEALNDLENLKELTNQNDIWILNP